MCCSHSNARSEPSLHHSSQQCQILNPLSEARDQTHNLMVPSQIPFRCAMTRSPKAVFAQQLSRIQCLGPCPASCDDSDTRGTKQCKHGVRDTTETVGSCALPFCFVSLDRETPGGNAFPVSLSKSGPPRSGSLSPRPVFVLLVSGLACWIKLFQR